MTIEQSIANSEVKRDACPYHDENWWFYQRDIERMRAELVKFEEDERYAVRRWDR